jgi:hypothetical protein
LSSTTTWSSVGTSALIRSARSRSEASIGELVAQVLALVGGVDRYADGAGQERTPPTEQRIGRVLDQGRNAVALLYAEISEQPGDAAPGLHDVGGRELRADDIEVLAVAIRVESRQ